MDRYTCYSKCLNYLSHQILQASMIRKDDEWTAQKVVTPFSNYGGDGVEFVHISRSSLDARAKNFTEIGDRT